MLTFTATNPDELQQIAEPILQAIGERRVVALHAPMGAGKTTLVRALCQAIGSESIVNSPTFAIVNQYDAPAGEAIYHIDLYRLRSLGEALDIGLPEYLDGSAYCFIEWPDDAAQLLPDDTCHITIRPFADGRREISVD